MNLRLIDPPDEIDGVPAIWRKRKPKSSKMRRLLHQIESADAALARGYIDLARDHVLTACDMVRELIPGPRNDD